MEVPLNKSICCPNTLTPFSKVSDCHRSISSYAIETFKSTAVTYITLLKDHLSRDNHVILFRCDAQKDGSVLGTEADDFNIQYNNCDYMLKSVNTFEVCHTFNLNFTYYDMSIH